MTTKFLHFNVILHPKASLKQKKMYQSRTVAAEPLSAQDVKNLAQNFLQLPSNAELDVPLKVGVTFLSLKDRYNKKEGRAEAVKRMATVLLPVVGVSISNTHIFIQMAEYKGITLLLRTNKASGFTTVTGTLTVGG